MKRSEKKSGSKRLKCNVLNYNFSPKGGIEGLIVEVAGKRSQVICPPHVGSELAQVVAEGDAVELLVEPEPPSPKGQSVHPVYRLLEIPNGHEHGSRISGKVERLNYAKHGEPNGVVLDTGDFVHLKPEGMRQTKLKIGDRVKAVGELSPMELGHHVLEATQVNDMRIEKLPKPH